MTSTTASTSTPAAVPINDYVNSQTTLQTPDKPLSEIPISQPTDGLSTAIPTPDPYFTHFDPRIEHQSYKVGLEVKLIYSYTIYSLDSHIHLRYRFVFAVFMISLQTPPLPSQKLIEFEKLIPPFLFYFHLTNRKHNNVSRRHTAKR